MLTGQGVGSRPESRDLRSIPSLWPGALPPLPQGHLMSSQAPEAPHLLSAPHLPASRSRIHLPRTSPQRTFCVPGLCWVQGLPCDCPRGRWVLSRSLLSMWDTGLAAAGPGGGLCWSR